MFNQLKIIKFIQKIIDVITLSRYFTQAFLSTQADKQII